MLTQGDLKAISNLIDDRLDIKIKPDLLSLRQNIIAAKKSILTTKKSILAQVIRSQNTIIEYFEKEYIRLQEQINDIKRRLHFSPVN